MFGKKKKIQGTNYNSNNLRRTEVVKTPLQKIGNLFLEILRLFLSVVFIFSGFVKAIDPLGSTYKIEDYLTAFGEPLVSFASIALPVAIFLSTFELMIGLAFLFKVKLKFTSVLSLLFMAVMLPLTLYIALNNPVTDCGCFGDALIITNWQTFYKNIAITFVVILMLIFNKQFRPLFLKAVEWLMLLIFIGIGVGISVLSYRSLPIFDFRPYKIGVNIPEAMKIPDGALLDEYETTLIYEKDGIKKEFNINNYPKDSTWNFVEQQTILVKEGYKPPIHDFTIVNQQGNDITDVLLRSKGTVNLLIMYDLNKVSDEAAEECNKLYGKIKEKGAAFIALTGSTEEVIAEFVERTGAEYPFGFTDPITLKTIVRSNPGLMMIEDGNIVGKWNWRNFNQKK